MAQTKEQMSSPEAKKPQAPTGPAAATVDERVLARRAREAKQAKATAVNEADRVSTDIGSPLVAPDGTLRGAGTVRTARKLFDGRAYPGPVRQRS